MLELAGMRKELRKGVEGNDACEIEGEIEALILGTKKLEKIMEVKSWVK